MKRYGTTPAAKAMRLADRTHDLLSEIAQLVHEHESLDDVKRVDMLLALRQVDRRKG